MVSRDMQGVNSLGLQLPESVQQSLVALQSNETVIRLNIQNKNHFVIGILNNSKDGKKSIVCICAKHGGLCIRRVDNAKKGGCECCSSKSSARLSAKKLISQEIPVDVEVKQVKIAEKIGNDRSKWIVEVIGPHFHLTCRKDRVKANLKDIQSRINRIKELHGDYLEFFIQRENGKILANGTCKLTQRKLSNYQRILELAPRAKESTRQKLQRQEQLKSIRDTEAWLRKNFNGPIKRSYPERKVAQALRDLKLPFTEQKTFPELKGQKAALRFDFYLPFLRLIIEADTIIHHKSIEAWGGDETRALRNEYDSSKKKWAKETPGVVFHLITDADKKTVRQIRDEISEVVSNIRNGVANDPDLKH